LVGAAFFLPHGVRIIARLQALLRREYHLNGYQVWKLGT
jgi:threonyl-tRNA synthetase